MLLEDRIPSGELADAIGEHLDGNSLTEEDWVVLQWNMSVTFDREYFSTLPSVTQRHVKKVFDKFLE